MPNPIDSENVIAWLNVQIEKVQGGWLHDYGFPTNVIAALTDVKQFVKNLPTIEPEVRHGRWIFVGEETSQDGWTHRKYKCSECEFQTVEAVNFCQKCGADMRDGGADNG
jgi:hypothetical protein